MMLGKRKSQFYWALQTREPEKRKLARRLLWFRYMRSVPGLVREGHPIDALGAAFGMRFAVRHALARLKDD